MLAVVQDGWKATEVAARPEVSRQSIHDWIARVVGYSSQWISDSAKRPGIE